MREVTQNSDAIRQGVEQISQAPQHLAGRTDQQAAASKRPTARLARSRHLANRGDRGQGASALVADRDAEPGKGPPSSKEP